MSKPSLTNPAPPGVWSKRIISHAGSLFFPASQRQDTAAPVYSPCLGLRRRPKARAEEAKGMQLPFVDLDFEFFSTNEARSKTNVQWSEKLNAAYFTLEE